MSEGWYGRWRQEGWTTRVASRLPTARSGSTLLEACAAHQVRFLHVKGHDGDELNEGRADRLAVAANSLQATLSNLGRSVLRLLPSGSACSSALWAVTSAGASTIQRVRRQPSFD
jgi:hypothetical protein